MIALLVACATARGPVTPVASLCGAEPAQAAEPVALPPLRVCPAGEPAWTLLGGGSCADSQCATWFVRSDAGGRCLDDRALGASHTAHYRPSAPPRARPSIAARCGRGSRRVGDDAHACAPGRLCPPPRSGGRSAGRVGSNRVPRASGRPSLRERVRGGNVRVGVLMERAGRSSLAQVDVHVRRLVDPRPSRCDGPGNGWPESAAWTRFQRERGGGRFLTTEHEGASWRRMTHVGYDSPDQAALREVLEAALSMTRAASTW